MTETQIKNAVRERDGFRCTKCGMTNEQHLEKWERVLHVHRDLPGSEYVVGPGCVTLCRDCHHEWHRNNDALENNQITLVINPEWVKRIRRQAARHGGDIRGYVRRAILGHVEADEKIERRRRRKKQMARS